MAALELNRKPAQTESLSPTNALPVEASAGTLDIPVSWRRCELNEI